MLADMGLDPIGIASDADQAMPFLEDGGADLVILDINLRGTKSYPLADWLKERGIAYIFASGYGDSEHPERHRQVPTITKPYTQSDLKAVLDSVRR